MTYRGFNIERVIYHANGDVMGRDVDNTNLQIEPRQRIEFVIFESVAGFHWEELGSANDLAVAMEMIDRVVAVREALSGVVGVAV